MSVINSLLPRIEIPENTSLHAFLDEKFAIHPGDKAAAIDVKTGKTVTYSALRKVVRCTAAGLARLGFQAGDLMLVLSHNTTDYVCTFLATWALGGVMSSATLGSSVEDVKRRIEVLLHCGKLKFMAADAASLDVSRQVAEIFDLTVIFMGDTSAGVPDGCISLSELASSDDTGFTPADITDTRKQLCCVFFSSGTTGPEKGILQTHYSLVANGLQSIASGWGCKSDDRTLLSLPLSHVGCWVCTLLTGLYIGATIIIETEFNLHAYVKAIEKYKVTHMSCVPTLVTFLAKDPIIEECDLSSLKLVNPTGCTVSKTMIDLALTRVTSLERIRSGFGMSESGLVIAEPSDRTKIGTVGQPLSNVECKVIDVETGVDVPAGGSGELLIRSPSIMLGYVNDPVSTANCMDSDGWLHSGDIVRYDEEGFVYVKDRIRDTMKVMRDGVITIYVSPSEVESVILSHPGVADTTVLGIHDEVLAYDLLRAFVVAREGVTVTAEEIKEHVKRNARLPEHCLTSGVTFLTEIPRTGSGKALRRVLRQTATET